MRKRTYTKEQADLIDLALRGIDAQIEELERKRAELLGKSGGRSISTPTTLSSSLASRSKKQSKFTAAHRAKLRAAAKRRWAKARAEKKQAALRTSSVSARKSVRRAAKN